MNQRLAIIPCFFCLFFLFKRVEAAVEIINERFDSILGANTGGLPSHLAWRRRRYKSIILKDNEIDEMQDAAFKKEHFILKHTLTS